MNTLLWVLQALGALLYASSGVMKTVLFDKVTGDVPSFGALPRRVWGLLGGVELVCAVGLVAPGLLGGPAAVTGVAAAVLSAESLVFIGVHVKYRELPPILFSAALGLAMAFVAYGRLVLVPAF